MTPVTRPRSLPPPRFLPLAALVVALAVPALAAAATVCNGAAELCGRPYDQVAFATTHNAHANRAEGYVFNASQTHTVTRQLEDGVRALMLDIHEWNGVVSLCHGPCGLASKPLAAGLAEIAAFLASHPNDVVTILFESYVTGARTAEVFAAAGLLDPAHPETDLLYEHAGGAWPTLGQMIAAGERLVVLTDENEQATYPWLHYLWSALAFETHWDVETVGDFSCADNRGTPGNDLFILNHFVTGPLGSSPTLAAQANANPFFLERALECEAFHGQIPNFVTVDYYEVGALTAVVDALNGVAPACTDGDGDGYGAPASGACAHPEPDCDDGDAAVNPGAAEVPGNGVDDDCDPSTPSGCQGELGSLALAVVVAGRRRRPTPIA